MGGHESGGYDMTPRCRQPVLADDRHFPETILEVLMEQPGQSGTGRIPGQNYRILPDFSPCPNQSQIELIVLVAYKALIEHPKVLERRFFPTTIGHSVDPALKIHVVK